MAAFSALLASCDPLPGYAGLPGRYDECRAPDGSVRPHWAEFLRELGADPSATLGAAAEACARAVLEQDVSMNVYAGDRSEPKPWPLDVVPHLVSSDDWEVLSNGLRQRARLYNTLAADLYGPQKFLRNGALPAQLAMANPHFLRPCFGLGNQPGVFLHHYAADIARAPDGQWWVISDRTQAPSGAGYALENRIVLSRILPDEFRDCQVLRLASFFRIHSDTLRGLAPHHRDNPSVVLLTPGIYNSAYFEHSFLARQMGVELVEGRDLECRDDIVSMRTTEGRSSSNLPMKATSSARVVLRLPGNKPAFQVSSVPPSPVPVG